MNIVLTGPMGSGKTAVGRKIAEKLNMNFIDSDTEIINDMGYSITELFKTDMESNVFEIKKKN